MRKILLIIANGMPAAMDIGLGAFIAAAVQYINGEKAEIGGLIAGSLLALMPDMFIIVPILRGAPGSTINAQHTWLPHRPLLMLVAVPVTIAIAFGLPWAEIAFLCLLWHFLHDTPPIGEAKVLNWKWPWGTDPVPDDYHWNWLEQVWLKPTARSVIEISIGSIALCTALTIGGYVLLASVALICIVFAMASIWLTWATANE